MCGRNDGKHVCNVCPNVWDDIDELCAHCKEKNHWGKHFNGSSKRVRKSPKYLEELFVTSLDKLRVGVGKS